ncbi:MAG TPA: hypothetical protein VHI78_09380 [Bacteroidales bacterium]|jgi:hypothetical protein|nr:hypothetical protein [Bacteroidales bacterium]
MGLFDFLKKKNNQDPALKPIEVTADEGQAMTVETNHLPNGTGIDSIYAFLQYDYESRGYSDALTSPDDSYRNDNINLLKQDLFILIDKSLTYYEGMLREVDFHINSRSRAGLIDLVEELKTRRELVSDHLGKIRVMKEEAVNDTGAVQRITLSYQRGFMRGLSALTQSNVLNKKL